MVLRRLTTASTKIHILSGLMGRNKISVRSKITTPSGAILPEPERTKSSYFQVAAGVCIGLIIGATISKNTAQFLGETNLFVPSDDDDDDDDD